MNNKQNIGLFGFGNVGSGLFHVLEKGKTVNAEIVKICIRKPEKQRSIDNTYFTTNADDILLDPNINLVVELIDDAEAAHTIVKKALQAGKNVVSGNKRMLAYHLEEFVALQRKHKVALLYEASACGSIPIIRSLEEYYDNDLLKSVIGILNGSSNYILTKLFEDNLDYQTALKQAQDLGFAESNPKFDVEGYDTLYKIVILSLHSIGKYVHPDNIFHYGISTIMPVDIAFAKEKRYKIKLIGQIIKSIDNSFTLFVIPAFVNKDSYIYNVENEYNGVVIDGECYEKQFMFGKGAGSYPTGSAVLSDITACMHNYRYEYKKLNFFQSANYKDDFLINIYMRYKSSSELGLFQFSKIYERFSGRNTNYVIGDISLKQLKSLQDILPNLDVFIAYTGNIMSE